MGCPSIRVRLVPAVLYYYFFYYPRCRAHGGTAWTTGRAGLAATPPQKPRPSVFGPLPYITFHYPRQPGVINRLNSPPSIIGRFGGADAEVQWEALMRSVAPVKAAAGAIPPMVLRSDPGGFSIAYYSIL